MSGIVSEVLVNVSYLAFAYIPIIAATMWILVREQTRRREIRDDMRKIRDEMNTEFIRLREDFNEEIVTLQERLREDEDQIEFLLLRNAEDNDNGDDNGDDSGYESNN